VSNNLVPWTQSNQQHNFPEESKPILPSHRKILDHYILSRAVVTFPIYNFPLQITLKAMERFS
jgi:hypothetical protein